MIIEQWKKLLEPDPIDWESMYKAAADLLCVKAGVVTVKTVINVWKMNNKEVKQQNHFNCIK